MQYAPRICQSVPKLKTKTKKRVQKMKDYDLNNHDYL